MLVDGSGIFSSLLDTASLFPECQMMSCSTQWPIDEEGRSEWAGLHAVGRHLLAIMTVLCYLVLKMKKLVVTV
jgi:hypothetical protein